MPLTSVGQRMSKSDGSSFLNKPMVVVIDALHERLGPDQRDSGVEPVAIVVIALADEPAAESATPISRNVLAYRHAVAFTSMARGVSSTISRVRMCSS